MGSSDGGNIPNTEGRGNLGAYTKALVKAPVQGVDPNALAAYQAVFGGGPSYQQMANANAMNLINNLPLNSGKYLVSPLADVGKNTTANQILNQQQPIAPAPRSPMDARHTTQHDQYGRPINTQRQG